MNAALAAAAGSADVVEVGDPFASRDGALSDDATIAFADALYNEQSFEVITEKTD